MAFEAFKDSSERAALNQERTLRKAREPFGQFQFVTVSFPAGSADRDIPHSLATETPDAIRWLVVMQDASASIYKDTAYTARVWTSSHISLRASAACNARLLLFVEIPANA